MSVTMWFIALAAVGVVALCVFLFLAIQHDRVKEAEFSSSRGSQHDPEVVRQFSSSLNISLADCQRMLDEVISSTPSVIEGRLLLGNAACSKDRASLATARVTHIVNATSNLPNAFEDDRSISYLRVPVDDSLSSDISSHFDDVVDWMASALSDPYAFGTLLVHCQQGISRSATLVIAFLMRERGMTLASALRHVHKRRWIRPNESFIKQLSKYETVLAARRQGPYAAPSNVAAKSD